MTISPIERLWRNPVNPAGTNPAADDVAISSRIRLARNLAEFPFPSAAAPEQLTAIRDLVADTVQRSRIFGAGMFRFDVAVLTTLDQEILFEVLHGGDEDACCKRLLQIALDRGAPDNVTVVLFRK